MKLPLYLCVYYKHCPEKGNCGSHGNWEGGVWWEVRAFKRGIVTGLLDGWIQNRKVSLKHDQ